MSELLGIYSITILFLVLSGGMFCIYNYKNIIIGARRGSPLAVGYSNEENYLGSDSYALKSMTNKISYLDDGEICVLTKENKRS